VFSQSSSPTTNGFVRGCLYCFLYSIYSLDTATDGKAKSSRLFLLFLTPTLLVLDAFDPTPASCFRFPVSYTSLFSKPRRCEEKWSSFCPGKNCSTFCLGISLASGASWLHQKSSAHQAPDRAPRLVRDCETTPILKMDIRLRNLGGARDPPNNFASSAPEGARASPAASSVRTPPIRMQGPDNWKSKRGHLTQASSLAIFGGFSKAIRRARPSDETAGERLEAVEPIEG